jgi:heptosyltransferase-1
MYGAATPASGARILVIRLGAMGDIVHALPAAASLRHGFAGSSLTWAVEPRWRPLLEDNPFVDRIVEVRRGSAAGLWASLRELRAERFDLAVDFQGLIKSALVAGLARVDRVHGFHRSQLREPLAALFYSGQTVSASTHVVDRNLDLAQAAGASSAVRSFPLPAGRPEGSLPAGFVLACPLAGWRSKQWPLEFYAEVAAALRREGLPLVLNGPPDAAELFSGVAGAVVHHSGLPGLIDATRRATAVIGVDSGPLHLAAALGKAGVAIFGPTDPARNGPYGGSLTVLRSPTAETTYKRREEIDESMRQVRPEQVLEALRESLAKRRSTGCAS